jgi:hypothetical protein
MQGSSSRLARDRAYWTTLFGNEGMWEQYITPLRNGAIKLCAPKEGAARALKADQRSTRKRRLQRQEPASGCQDAGGRLMSLPSSGAAGY